jgi:hypothetical protein
VERHSIRVFASHRALAYLGDGIDFWSHVNLGNSGQYILQLDGGPPETVTLNVAEPNPRMPIWQKSGLTLGDHELFGSFVCTASGTGSGSRGYLDMFACVTTSVVHGHSSSASTGYITLSLQRTGLT